MSQGEIIGVVWLRAYGLYVYGTSYTVDVFLVDFNYYMVSGNGWEHVVSCLKARASYAFIGFQA